MKKLLTFCAAVLASVSMWAAYAPTADEVIILNDVYDASATEAGFSNHAAIAWGGTVSFSDKRAGDPNNNGEQTSSNVKTCSVKGNGKGKNLIVSFEGCSQIIVYHEKQSSRYVELRDGSATGTLIGKSEGNTYFTAVDLNANNSYSIFLHGVKSDGADQDFYIYAVKLIKGETCNDPSTPLSITSDVEGAIYAGDAVNLTISGGNGATPVVLLDGVEFEGTTWTAVAGTHTFSVIQAENEGYCAQVDELELTVLAADAVESVTIEGPAAAYVGESVTFTATAENASDYAWTVNGVDANTNAAEFIFTPAAVGEYSIVCSARNQFNAADVWIPSEAKVLTVTKLCGELIKAEHDGTAKGATVSGVVGGTVDKNTQAGGKLGSNGHYFGVKLASGSFQPGDVVTVVASQLQGGNNATLYSDKGTTSLGSAAFDAETLTATVTLTQSAEWIYLYRVDGAICNPVMGYISVTRSCEDSNDASIHSLTINGEEVAKDAEANKYEYTVSASYEAATVEVAFDIHPLATASIDSPFNINVPEAGADANGQAITVTAEDGTQVTYTVFVSKSASLSNDATLQALAVEGYTLSPAFDPAITAYTITKAYEDALPAVSAVTATLNDANATLLGISYNETLTNEIDIQIMAEDGETAGTYTIMVNSEEAKKDLSRVLFSNGFDAFIDNTAHTVKAFYLAGTEAPTATTITAGNGTAGELAEDKIVVTGADNSIVEYAVTLEAVTPNTTTVAEDAAAGAFDGTEDWVKSGLYMSNAAGFATDKYVLRRGLRGSDAATDQRVIAGWVRAYFFVGNASKFEMAVTGNKPLKYAVDGGEYTEVNADNISIALGAGNHMIEIVTNQTSGDCNLSAPKLVERASDPTALDNTEAGMKAVKRIVDGQLLIEKNGVLYNAQGARL